MPTLRIIIVRIIIVNIMTVFCYEFYMMLVPFLDPIVEGG